MRDAGDARDPTHVVSRALVLSNGALGAEGQCLGLARALGFHDPEVHLVGEAALALAPRFSAAWSEKVPVDGARSGDNARGGTRGRALALSAGAAQMVRRVGRRVDPMPRAQSAAAKLLRLLPASLHVRLHALWERAFGARFDEVWLGADLAEVAAALRDARDSNVLGEDAGNAEATPRRKRKNTVCREEKAPCADNKTLVLACGRGAVPAAAAVRRRHGDVAVGVVAQHPRVRFSAFDLVVAPAHDADAKENGKRQRLVLTKGALHRFDPAFARAAREAWRDAMAAAPAPRLAVAVGGPTRLCRFGMPESFAAELVECIANAIHSTHFASAFVAFSARTPKAVKHAVERAMAEKGLTSSSAAGPVARTFDPAARTKSLFGENTPYAGAMAWADGVLVTADSCSMLSEAVSLGVPVFVSRFKNARGKTARFLAACATRGECVDAATVFASRESAAFARQDDAAAERLASFIRYRRSVAREETPSRGVRGDLERVAARVRELVEVRADGRRETDGAATRAAAEPSGKRRLQFEEEVA
jgi:mitochondrial fission protein ELM1